MPRKCLIPCCKTKYYSRKESNKKLKKIPVFRLPKSKEECAKWMKSLPYKNLHTSVNSVICEVHWPSNYATVTLRGKSRPKDPSLVWPGVPSSCIPTPFPKERTTLRSSISVRAIQPDELKKFLEQDTLAFADLRKQLKDEKESFSCSTTVYLSSSSLCIQSSELSGCVPKFIIKIEDTLKFETFHMGVRIPIPWLYKNNITQLQSRSTIEKLVRHLSTYEVSHQVNVIREQMSSMSSCSVGKKMYSPNAIVRAFEYFSMSRSLYKKLRNDFQLPSIYIFQRIDHLKSFKR